MPVPDKALVRRSHSISQLKNSQINHKQCWAIVCAEWIRRPVLAAETRRMRCSCLAGVVETRLTGRNPRWNKPSPADAPSSPLPPPPFSFVATAVQRGRSDPILTRSAETETQTDGGVGAVSGSATTGSLANTASATSAVTS